MRLANQIRRAMNHTIVNIRAKCIGVSARESFHHQKLAVTEFKPQGYRAEGLATVLMEISLIRTFVSDQIHIAQDWYLTNA